MTNPGLPKNRKNNSRARGMSIHSLSRLTLADFHMECAEDNMPHLPSRNMFLGNGIGSCRLEGPIALNDMNLCVHCDVAASMEEDQLMFRLWDSKAPTPKNSKCNL